MNFLCPACRTPLPGGRASVVVPCAQCGVQVDLARVETAPGTARLSPEVDLTGDSLGGFRLVGRLGAGGMGTVYAAEGYAGPCAVKVLSALVAADPAVRARFRREAEALRQVQHPAIVRVLAEGEERGFCWYAMERVDGPDLRARLTKDGALPWPEVEGLARRLLDALGAAHERGFVHRDVKPGNILLAPDGAKLCDFGIARLDGATTLTQSAALIGSLRYMAPEQQRLGRAVAQSDLYSLGLVLHEALAGGLPGEKPLPPGVPRHLRRLLERLLSERIEGRPDSAVSATRLLERRVPVGALSVGTSAALALAAFLLLPPGSPAPAVNQGTAVTKEGPATPEPQAPAQEAPREPPASTQALAQPTVQTPAIQQAKQVEPPPPEPSRLEAIRGRGTRGGGLGALAAPRKEKPQPVEDSPALETRGRSGAFPRQGPRTAEERQSLEEAFKDRKSSTKAAQGKP